MCRIATIIGEESTVRCSINIIEAFKEASKQDPFKPRGEPEHRDGWGFVAVSLERCEKTKRLKPRNVITYKSSKPVFEDTSGLNFLKNILNDSEKYIVLLHSRAASEGEKDAYNAHPFHFSVRGIDLWLIHNGTMNKEALAGELSIEPVESLSDTYYLGKFILKDINMLSFESLKSAFSRASNHTRTAMITTSLIYDSKSSKIHVFGTNYIRNPTEEATRYYTLYLVNLKEQRLIAWYSSTIAYYLSKEGMIEDAYSEKNMLENGNIIYVEIPLNNLQSNPYFTISLLEA